MVKTFLVFHYSSNTIDRISQTTNNQPNFACSKGNKGALDEVSVSNPSVVDVTADKINNSKMESVSNNLNLDKVKAELLTPRRRSVRLNQKLNKTQQVEDHTTSTKV